MEVLMFFFGGKAAKAVGGAASKPDLGYQIESMLSVTVKWLNLPPGYTPFVEWGLRIGGALLIFFLFLVLARRSQLERIVGWVDEKIGVIQLTISDRNFIAFTAWVLLWIPGLVLILFMLKLTALLATVGLSAGVLTAILATSNRSLSSNISAGFALQARRHINRGDFIKVMKLSGTLDEIGLTSCVLEDVDGVRHFIPNSKLLNEVLTNYSLATFRRVEISFWFDQDEVELDEVEDVLYAVMAEAPGKKSGKEAFFRYGACTEKGQEVKLYLYFETENWGEDSSIARRLLLEKIEASEIRMGIPQQLTLFVEKDGAGSVLEKEAKS